MIYIWFMINYIYWYEKRAACLFDTVDGFPSSSSSSSSLFLRDCQPQRKLGPYTILCRSQYPRRTSDNKSFPKRYPWEETEHSLSLSRRPPSWQSMNMRRRRTMPIIISTGIGGIKDIWRIRQICQNLNLPKFQFFLLQFFCHLALSNVVSDALQGCTFLLRLEEAGQGEPLQLHAEKFTLQQQQQMKEKNWKKKKCLGSAPPTPCKKTYQAKKLKKEIEKKKQKI